MKKNLNFHNLLTLTLVNDYNSAIAKIINTRTMKQNILNIAKVMHEHKERFFEK